MNFNIQRFAEDTAFLKDNLTGFVPTVQATDIIKTVTRNSSILRLSKVEVMESDNKTFPVFVSGPGAYWTDETSRIKTDKAKWIFPQIVAKKLAVAIPVTNEKLKDTTINVFEELKPYIADAFQKTIDSACIFGTDSPFAHNIYDDALSNSMAIALGTNAKLDLDISDVMALVEAKGFDINGFVADIGFKNSLRKLRDGNGNQLYYAGVATGNGYDTLYSLPIEFSRNNSWDNTKALCIGGDFKNYSIVGIREQISYKISTEGTFFGVTLEDGKPLSLVENDMVAIIATMRLGFLPVKPEAFAILVPTGAATTSTSTDGTDTSVTPSNP